MTPMSEPVDWNSPCARFQALQSAYFALVSGSQEIEIRTRTLDAEELVRFNQANMNVLRNEMRAAEAACLALTGQPNPNRRFAIGLSYRPAGRIPATSYDPQDPRN